MTKQYIRRIYRNGDLIKHEIVRLPTKIEAWHNSSKRDRLDGYDVNFTSRYNEKTKEREVIRCKSVYKLAGITYYYDLLKTEKGKELLKKLRG